VLSLFSLLSLLSPHSLLSALSAMHCVHSNQQRDARFTVRMQLMTRRVRLVRGRLLASCKDTSMLSAEAPPNALPAEQPARSVAV